MISVLYLRGLVPYIALGFGILAALLLLIQVLKKLAYLSNQKKLRSALESKGLTSASSGAEGGYTGLSDMKTEESYLQEKERTLKESIDRLYTDARSVTDKQKMPDIHASKDDKQDIQPPSKGPLHRLCTKAMSMTGKQEEKTPAAEKVIIKEKEMDADVKKVLKITDELLERLPEDVIEKFVSSNEFELYKKVIEKAKQ